MGAVADVNYGFKGQVSSAQTPVVLGKGALYSVVGSGLQATAGGAGDRSVTVSPGVAWGDGVLSVWNTPAVLNAAANNTSVTRWDTLVDRRHSQPSSSPTGTSTLMLLTGGAQKAIATSRKTDRGVTDSDQPLWLVPVAPGSAVAGTPVDVRCWTGSGGGLWAASIEALQYLDDVGTTVRIGRVRYTRMLDQSGTAFWDEEYVGTDVPWTNAPLSGGALPADYPLMWSVRSGQVTLTGGAKLAGSAVWGGVYVNPTPPLPPGIRPTSTVQTTAVSGSRQFDCVIQADGRVELRNTTGGGVPDGSLMLRTVSWPAP